MTSAASSSETALAELRARLDGRPLVFFDGSCVMCNGFVRFAHKHDRRDALRFAPLDSGAFRAVAAAFPALAGVDSMVLLRFNPGGGPLVSVRSGAALGALAALGGPWALLAGAGRLIPRPLRDAAYRLIAATRYKIFGRYPPGACPLPPPALAAKLLR